MRHPRRLPMMRRFPWHLRRNRGGRAIFGERQLNRAPASGSTGGWILPHHVTVAGGLDFNSMSARDRECAAQTLATKLRNDTGLRDLICRRYVWLRRIAVIVRDSVIGGIVERSDAGGRR